MRAVTSAVMDLFPIHRGCEHCLAVIGGQGPLPRCLVRWAGRLRVLRLSLCHHQRSRAECSHHRGFRGGKHGPILMPNAGKALVTVVHRPTGGGSLSRSPPPVAGCHWKHSANRAGREARRTGPPVGRSHTRRAKPPKPALSPGR